MFGLSFDKLIVIALIAAVVIGPQRLPTYASKLASLVVSIRKLANGAGERLRGELGPEFDEVDWKKLDPRQYDPRRIILDALSTPAADPTDQSGPYARAAEAEPPEAIGLSERSSSEPS